MKNLLKTLFTTLCIITLGLSVYADNTEDAKKFFNKYISAANSYSDEVPNLYSSNAKIIRQVVKPDGSLVNVPFTIEQYRKQLKISSSVAKMRNYKNKYSNIKVTKIDEKTFKIDSYRQASTGGDKLKVSTTVQKQPNGNWLIIRELMQTKEQVFLKYAK